MFLHQTGDSLQKIKNCQKLEELHFLQSQLGNTSVGPENSSEAICAEATSVVQTELPQTAQQIVLQQSHQPPLSPVLEDLQIPEASVQIQNKPP